jgi:predicted ATPase
VAYAASLKVETTCSLKREHDIRGNGSYVLDEPEAALSPAGQFKLLQLLHRHVRNRAQFMIAAHSPPILMGYPDATIFLANEEGINKVNYEETEHYRLTKRFLDDRQDVLDDLLY